MDTAYSFAYLVRWQHKALTMIEEMGHRGYQAEVEALLADVSWGWLIGVDKI